MEIGKLDRRITFQTRSTTKDKFGQKLTVWSDFATVWANVKSIGGVEKMRASSVGSTLSHVIVTRYSPDYAPLILASAMRIKYGDRILNIQTASETDDRKSFITFSCDEGSADGQ